ncbi:hypothetical protein [Paracoccus fontiphilus]|uniref:Transcription elongation protein SprT n=1 Tax=Paracoccus fontiphilus TaxID=1815556 RepID=A0ABV7IM14_9RHOB|nr:hypothetical protein [Paracoccus fontiphilus]
MKSEAKVFANKYDSRESWLRAATNVLRPYFSECGLDLPEKIRFAIAFPSTGRTGKRVGECWHFSASADETTEIIVRADLADPVEVLGVLTHELVHACLPADAGHGKQYKAAALALGLSGPMRSAMPGPLLQTRLAQIADDLGPLPHAALAIDRGRDNKGPADRPKRQKARMHKAECEATGCGYTVRVAAKWVNDVGPPACPVHGPMTVDLPEAAESSDDEETPGEDV